MTRPLEGVRVLDLSRLLPGGYCTLVLADLGADVVKVEEPGRGDYLRWMPPYAGTGEGAMHRALNRGKRSVTCNLRCEDGREVLRRLAETADVLVESFRPGVLDRLGVGYPALRAVNSRLVYVAISGYGATGPYAGQAGHDINYLGYAGALSFTGHPDTGPWPPGVQVADIGGGGWPAAVAVLAALRARDATGEGQFCDVAMTDGVLSWLAVHAAAAVAAGRLPRPGTELLNGGYACYGTYRCADGRYVTVGALEPQFFAALLAGLEVDVPAGWQLDRDRQAELRARIAAAFGTRSRAAWLAVFDGTDACVGPVNDLAEALADPSARARGMVVDVGLPDGTPSVGVGATPRLAGAPAEPDWRVPALGEDTDAVLAAAGYSPAQVADLRAAGAV